MSRRLCRADHVLFRCFWVLLFVDFSCARTEVLARTIRSFFLPFTDFVTFLACGPRLFFFFPFRLSQFSLPSPAFFAFFLRLSGVPSVARHPKVQGLWWSDAWSCLLILPNLSQELVGISLFFFPFSFFLDPILPSRLILFQFRLGFSVPSLCVLPLGHIDYFPFLCCCSSFFFSFLL